MGILTTFGSLARVVGPLMFSWLYNNYGTYATFGTLVGALACATIICCAFYKRFLPTLQDKDMKKFKSSRLSKSRKQQPTSLPNTSTTIVGSE